MKRKLTQVILEAGKQIPIRMAARDAMGNPVDSIPAVYWRTRPKQCGVRLAVSPDQRTVTVIYKQSGNQVVSCVDASTNKIIHSIRVITKRRKRLTI